MQPTWLYKTLTLSISDFNYINMVSKASGLTTLGILIYTSFAYNSAMKLPFVFIFIKKSEQDKQFKCLLTLMFFPENQGNELFDKLHSFGVVPIMTIYSHQNITNLSINVYQWSLISTINQTPWFGWRWRIWFLHDVVSRDCSIHVSASVLVSPAWANVVESEALWRHWYWLPCWTFFKNVCWINK